MWKYVFSYCGVLLIFASANWVTFKLNSTSFLISEQLNKHLDRYVFLDTEIDLASYHQDAKDEIPISVSIFNDLIKPEFDSLSTLNQLLERTHNQRNANEAILDSLYTVSDKERKTAIDKYRENALSDLNNRITELKKYVSERDSTQMILDGHYVKLAQLEFELAKKDAEVSTIILENYGHFVPDTLISRILFLNQNHVILTAKIEHIESSRRVIISKIRDSINKFHYNRSNSVSFLDFLYYSICISTTVSFGDIAPNNTWTRALAVFELLLCLVIVGIIVESIRKNSLIV